MRKIEKGMCAAVKARKAWHCGNTNVNVIKQDSTTKVDVYLHGHPIYTLIEETGTDYKLELFTLAGWNTNTTRGRLTSLGVQIRTRKKNGDDESTPQRFRNGTWEDIDAEEWYVNVK